MDYRVPWFVPEVDGVFDFRFMGHEKFVEALKWNKCWICGQRLGVNRTFVAGPMCCITRTQPEPPSHLECARWAVQVCPFLSNANRERRSDERSRELDKPENIPGEMIKRNPGVTALWTTRTAKVWKDQKGLELLEMGDPEDLEWWKEGRAATAEEIILSINSGLPTLTELCESMRDHKDLAVAIDKFTEIWLGFYNKKNPLPAPPDPVIGAKAKCPFSRE
jgi:hypothetical protein